MRAHASLGTFDGDVAEWLRSGLQSRLHRFDSGRRLSNTALNQRFCLRGPGQVANFVPTLSRDASPAKSRSHLDAVSGVGELGSDPDRVSGHLNVRKGKRGDVFYAKYRLSDGRQVQQRLGPAWTKAGRPPQGFYTRRTAELALAAILTDARRGTLAGMRRIEATFADAAAEFLRYVERVRQREPSTLRDYCYVIDGHLLPAFGERKLETITADDIDAYKERLLASGRLSNRSVVRAGVETARQPRLGGPGGATAGALLR